MGPWEAAMQGPPAPVAGKETTVDAGRPPQGRWGGGGQSLGPAADRPPLWGPCPREDGPAGGSSRPDSVRKSPGTCSLKFERFFSPSLAIQ